MPSNHLIPDLTWYQNISDRHRLSPRCPFASVERCPRYYQSLSLLGSAGSTEIDHEEDERLKRYWEGSDLWPRTREYETAVLTFKKQDGSENQHFSKFCPEVTFDRFGYFSAHLAGYADEIDSDFAHKRLGEAHVPSDDWRWQWSSVQPMHYTECPLYSPLVHGGGFPAKPEGAGPEVTFGPRWAQIRFRFSWRELREWVISWWARLKRFIPQR